MSDLYYYRARYYDPHAQRFISMDPIEFESGDFNFYRYVGSDPVNRVDPSGLDWREKLSDVWDAGPYDAFRAGTFFKDRAIKAAKKFYKMNKNILPKSDPLHNTMPDAFRHCVWSCLMAKAFGDKDAEEIGYNHEDAGDREHNQPFEEKLMDLANNAIGRECAKEKNSKSCEKRCLEKAKQHKLVALR